MISYKPLKHTLVEKSVNLTWLRENVGLSFNTVTKINKNEGMNLDTIDRICQALECSITDVVEILPDKKQD